jgi:protein MpaA
VRTEVIGTSVEGRPITVEVLGAPAPRRVLVVGVIHGNEEAGLEVIDALRTLGAPADTELWLLPTLNPDGLAAGKRQNANAVDLNRNFPHNWQPLGQPGDSQYAGVGPASEPETQAFVAFAERLKPDITLWYHQDLFRISPAEGFEGQVRARYAELTGLPMDTITGGVYTGIAATWQRRTQGSVSFVVELGPELAQGEAARHADAVHQIAALLPDRDGAGGR